MWASLLPKQGCLWGQTRLLRAWTSWSLKPFKDGDGTASWGDLLCCLTVFIGKWFLSRVGVQNRMQHLDVV